jgi:hypothetical protein
LLTRREDIDGYILERRVEGMLGIGVTLYVYIMGDSV